jgi:hypothetical protein
MRLGSKHALLVDANNAPLVIRNAPANASNSKLTQPVVANFPAMGGKVGRPRKHPDASYAHRGCDYEAIQQDLRSQGHGSRQQPRANQMGGRRYDRLLQGSARLTIRDDRSDDVQDAWNRLAASVPCYRVVIRWGICHGEVLSRPQDG